MLFFWKIFLILFLKIEKKEQGFSEFSDKSLWEIRIEIINIYVLFLLGAWITCIKWEFIGQNK